MHAENFSGIITANGQISMVGHESGIILGEMIGPGQMELRSLEGGDNTKAYLVILTRQNS